MKKKIYRLCCATLLLGFSMNAQAQMMNTFAGTMAGAGYTGDGGPSYSAQLNHPRSVVMDDTGNIYIADTYNNLIRKVTPGPANIISTFSGVIAAGFGGDGGPARYANYDHPSVVAIDGNHNFYILDGGNECVRKIDNTGIISTVVGDGSGNTGFAGDGGPATAALLNSPTALALDNAGNIYIADGTNNCIRKVDVSTGIISTIAGIVGTGGYSGEGGPATAAAIDFPYGLAIDNSGNIFVSLNFDDRICKIDAAGIITTYAGVGGGAGGYSGDNGPATAATFDGPWGLSLDHAGNLYIADNNNNAVRMVNTSGIVTTIAGTGGYYYTGDLGPATAATMRIPTGMTVGPDGTVYIADYNNFAVRTVSGTLTNPPTFVNGHSQAMPAFCVNDPAASINSLLAVTDLDAGQLETWSLVLAPVHGTAVATYTTTSTGSTLTPTGLTYGPTAGYIGTDSFKVRITDGTASDTTTVIVTVNSCTVNNPPSFIHGHSQSLSVCEDTLLNTTNALLSVSDADASQTITWSLTTGPVHGTAVATYSTTSTGGTLVPTGLSYSPTIGYIGNDSFKVHVSDGTAADSTVIHVSITACTTGIPNISGGDNGIRIFPDPNPGAFTFNLSSNTNEKVQVTITNMVGEKVKEFTTVANSPTDIRLNQPAGVYFINATTINGKWSAKIVIAP